VTTADAERRELLALKWSSGLTTGFALTAAVLTIFSDSETMAFEGLSGMVDVVVSLLAIFVVRRVLQPPDVRYPFGYAKYEPLMTALNGVMLGTVCVASFLSAVQDIAQPDPVEGVWVVKGYSLESFVTSVAFGTWMKRVGAQSGSQLLPAEADLWVVEGWMAFGVFAAFAAAVALDRLYPFPYTAYVDPGVTLILSAVFIYKPLQILKECWVDLVDANPYHGTTSDVEAAAAAGVEPYRLQIEWLKARRAGRKTFVLVSVRADRQRPLHELETVRSAITAGVTRAEPQADVQVLFSGA
jgi:cation diffusion facilitator family transporter